MHTTTTASEGKLVLAFILHNTVVRHVDAFTVTAARVRAPSPRPCSTTVPSLVLLLSLTTRSVSRYPTFSTSAGDWVAVIVVTIHAGTHTRAHECPRRQPCVQQVPVSWWRQTDESFVRVFTKQKKIRDFIHQQDKVTCGRNETTVGNRGATAGRGAITPRPPLPTVKVVGAA